MCSRRQIASIKSTRSPSSPMPHLNCTVFFVYHHSDLPCHQEIRLREARPTISSSSGTFLSSRVAHMDTSSTVDLVFCRLGCGCLLQDLINGQLTFMMMVRIKRLNFAFAPLFEISTRISQEGSSSPSRHPRHSSSEPPLAALQTF